MTQTVEHSLEEANDLYIQLYGPQQDLTVPFEDEPAPLALPDAPFTTAELLLAVSGAVHAHDAQLESEFSIEGDPGAGWQQYEMLLAALKALMGQAIGSEEAPAPEEQFLIPCTIGVMAARGVALEIENIKVKRKDLTPTEQGFRVATLSAASRWLAMHTSFAQEATDLPGGLIPVMNKPVPLDESALQ